MEEQLKKPLLERSAVCYHTEEQRTLTGTWCSPELQKAVELGYHIDYIYEVWQFDDTCEGLFEDYVNTWLKIKQEASGWPSWVGEDEEKRQQSSNLRRDRYQRMPPPPTCQSNQRPPTCQSNPNPTPRTRKEGSFA